MPVELGWEQLGLRLALTVIAGILVGIDRGRHGRPVGLRTTLLVCLAASVSMIQANLLLPTAGKTDGSFATLDLMRLPLGILTGMGFIGGGAILKKEDIVVGVTTAATLWFVTVVGLCIGGGQIGLGIAALAIGLVVLKSFKHIEDLLLQEHRASLRVTGTSTGYCSEDVQAEVTREGFSPGSALLRFDTEKATWTLQLEIRWLSRKSAPLPPAFVKPLSLRPGISLVEWTPVGRPSGTFQ